MPENATVGQDDGADPKVGDPPSGSGEGDGAGQSRPPAGNSATRVGPYSGTVTIDDKLTFHIQLLAYASVRGIAAEIAKRVAAYLGPDRAAVTIVVADDPLLAAMAEYRVIAARMASLEDALRSLAADLESAAAAESLSPVGEIAGAIGAVSDLLSWFRVDAEYKGRDVDVEGALRPALLGQLIALGVTPMVIDGVSSAAGMSDARSLVASVQRLLTVKSRVEAQAARAGMTIPGRDPSPRAGTDPVAGAAVRSRPAGPLGQAADPDGAGGVEPAPPTGFEPPPEPGQTVVAEPKAPAVGTEPSTPSDTPAETPEKPGPTADPDAKAPLQQRCADLSAAVDDLIVGLSGDAQDKGRLPMLVAAGQACVVIDDAPVAFLLQAKTLKAGGHYMVRKSLFASLFGLDALRFGGGAAVSFMLTDAKRSSVLLSDLVLHAHPNVAFPSSSDKRTPSTLSRFFDDPGFLPLPLPKPAAPASPPALRQDKQPEANVGDDAAVDDEDRRTGSPPPSKQADAAAAIPFRLAVSLLTLRSQIDAKAPHRGTASDGWIGDAAHQSRDSDHNPWVRDARGIGVVTAIDVTHDPARGCSADLLAETLRAGRDQRVKYIIWNRRIANASPVDGAAAWAWRPYGGHNPHTKHIHISVRSDPGAYDSPAVWQV